jgi:hypothetical protein
MTYHEFLAILTLDNPSLDGYRGVVQFVESAEIETLWSALFTPGIHWIFRAVINKTLQEKVARANLDAAVTNITKKFIP